MNEELVLVQNLIHEIRGKRVMLDFDLARLYHVETRSALPFAFTEQGIAMLSGVLKSDIAIEANIAIMRAFVQVREYLLATSSLSAELKELKARVDLLQQTEVVSRPRLRELDGRLTSPLPRTTSCSPGNRTVSKTGVFRKYLALNGFQK